MLVVHSSRMLLGLGPTLPHSLTQACTLYHISGSWGTIAPKFTPLPTLNFSGFFFFTFLPPRAPVDIRQSPASSKRLSRIGPGHHHATAHTDSAMLSSLGLAGCVSAVHGTPLASLSAAVRFLLQRQIQSDSGILQTPPSKAWLVATKNAIFWIPINLCGSLGQFLAKEGT